MRLALVHYSAPPVAGGVEQILAAHAQLFRTHGCEVRLICRRGDADILLREPEPYEELNDAIHDVDAVIVHNVLTMPFDLALTLAIWRLSSEKPLKRWIAWVHDLAACNRDYQYDWRVLPWTYLAQACPGFEYVAVSDARAQQARTLLNRPVFVVPNGIAPAEVLGLSPAVTEFATRHGLCDRELVLLHPTRLLKRKNVGFGLEVLASLRASGRDAALLITALPDAHNSKSREYAEALREQREELGLEAAAIFVSDEFLPQRDDLASLYRLADALFFPSTQEGFGLPIIEAALHGMPVFCADSEPMNSLLENSIHVFALTASPPDVAELVRSVLEQSPPFLARREAMERFRWDVVWEKHLAPLLTADGALP